MAGMIVERKSGKQVLRVWEGYASKELGIFKEKDSKQQQE